MLFYLIVIFATVIDQVSKIVVRSTMEVGETIPYHPLVHFSFYENSGMAMSLFQGYGRYFGVAAILFVVLILSLRRKGELRGIVMDMSTGFLVGGAVGNGIDRILYGKVTDFLQFRSGRGILNLADIAINIGVMLFIVGILIKLWSAYKLNKTLGKQGT